MPIARVNQGEVTNKPLSRLPHGGEAKPSCNEYLLWKIDLPTKQEKKPTSYPLPSGEGQADTPIAQADQGEVPADMPIAQPNQGEVLPRRTDSLPHPEDLG